MSIESQLIRLIDLRDRQRTKLTSFDLATVTSDLEDCTEAIESMVSQSATTITPDDESHTITAGKYLTGNILVESIPYLETSNGAGGLTAMIGPAPDESLIQFKIANQEQASPTYTTYSAVEGMTWRQWVNSEYNTGAYIINSGDVRTTSSPLAPYVCNADGSRVNASDLVATNYSYLIVSNS